MDLVEVNIENNIPICKILDYQKYIYNQKKKLKNNKNKSIVTKEIKLHLNTSENDINIKVNNVKRILNEGCKVKISLILKGRENLFKEKGEKTLQIMFSKLEDVATMSSPIKTIGNTSFMIVSKK